MPQLNKQDAKGVAETEVQNFQPIPDGWYPGVLNSVDVKEGQKGPYWAWEFQIPPGHKFVGRRFWNNTSLTEASRFKMRESFDAFEVAADTDTDELVGCWVAMQIGTRTIQGGSRAGELANTIMALKPYREEDFTNEIEPQEEPF